MGPLHNAQPTYTGVSCPPFCGFKMCTKVWYSCLHANVRVNTCAILLCMFSTRKLADRGRACNGSIDSRSSNIPFLNKDHKTTTKLYADVHSAGPKKCQIEKLEHERLKT